MVLRWLTAALVLVEGCAAMPGEHFAMPACWHESPPEPLDRALDRLTPGTHRVRVTGRWSCRYDWTYPLLGTARASVFPQLTTADGTRAVTAASGRIVFDDRPSHYEGDEPPEICGLLQDQWLLVEGTIELDALDDVPAGFPRGRLTVDRLCGLPTGTRSIAPRV